MSLRMVETHACQGGGTAGYLRAGWDVTVVDINKAHAKYHPGRAYLIGDAATYLRNHGHEFDAASTSPACQWYSRGNAPGRGGSNNNRWHRSIPPVREALKTTGKPYVIENVKDAVWDMVNPVMLCGCMFNLSTIDTDGIRIHLQRPRFFELGGWDIPGLVEQTIGVRGQEWVVRSPRECDHSDHEWVAGAYGGARRDKYEAKYVRRGGYVPREKSVVQALMGIEHNMTWNGLFEALPPAYTHYIGTELAKVLS